MYLKGLKKEISLAAIVLGTAFLTSSMFALGQEAQYTTAEYNAYQKAISEGEDSIIEFVEAHPDSALKQYAVGAYQQLVKDYLDKGQHKEAAAAAEKYLESIDGESFQMVYLATWCSFYSQQYDKAVSFGERAFQMNSDAPELEHLVPIMARAYASSGDQTRSLPYAEKYCAKVPPKDCYDLLPQIMRHYAEKKEWAKAASYAEMTIEAFDAVEKPAQVAESEWDNFTSEEKSVAYAIIGRHAAETKKWSSAERAYASSRKLSPKNRARSAEGYFYAGMAQWNREQIDAAMQSFARGSLLKGTPHADPCRKELERLYKATHNGSLAGLEEYLDNVASW